MDTNALAVILNNLTEIVARQKAVVGPLGPNSVLITYAIIASLVPTLAAVAGWIKSRSIEKVVNGDRVRMVEELKQKDLRLVELEIRFETSKAVMEERLRWRDADDVRKEVVEIKAIAKEEGKAEAAKEIIAVSNNQTKG